MVGLLRRQPALHTPQTRLLPQSKGPPIYRFYRAVSFDSPAPFSRRPRRPIWKKARLKDRARERARISLEHLMVFFVLSRARSRKETQPMIDRA